MQRFQRLTAPLASLVALAAATGAIYLLRPLAPDLSLGVLYLFAVLPIAVVWGLGWAIAVSILSMLAFNFLFLPPVHTLELRDSENWIALAVYLFTAVVVSELAARARRRADDAEQREREATFLADVSVALLERGDVQGQLREIGEAAARVLGVPRVRIELDSVRRPGSGEIGYDLRVGERHVGRLFVDRRHELARETEERILPALASLLATSGDRERLGQRALEAEAFRRSDAMKTAILRSVSHDLRSPLTAIRAAAEGLRSGALELGTDDRAVLLDSIAIEAQRLDRLVSNLIDLSRIESGAATPRPELWTIDSLVARALDAVGPDGERVNVTLSSEPPAVRVDGSQLERVLVNLIENALRFSAPDRTVEIEAEGSGDEVVLRVTDRGPGLSHGELERIFEPFQRVGQPGDRTGTGLGLAIASGFVQVNGGRIWAESSPGKGATFLVALPAEVTAEVRA